MPSHPIQKRETIYNPKSTSVYRSSNMDPFSQIIALLRPQAVFWQIIEAHDDWTISFNPSSVVVFGQLLEGRARIERPDGIGCEAEVGDFMLMPLPPPWAMSAGNGAPPIDLKQVMAEPTLLLTSKPRTVTRIMAGNFKCEAGNEDLITRLIPPLVHVRSHEVSAGRLGALLQMVGDEALTERPGRSLILDRLLETLLIEALRSGSAPLGEDGQRLMAGLAEPKIAQALNLLHGDAKKPWTVERLARDVGMSRSAFAALFARTVGLPPMDYLAQWRMTLARNALLSSDLPMTDIADLAGYQSVSAFSTAFRRVNGCSPMGYVRGRKMGMGEMLGAPLPSLV